MKGTAFVDHKEFFYILQFLAVFIIEQKMFHWGSVMDSLTTDRFQRNSLF